MSGKLVTRVLEHSQSKPADRLVLVAIASFAKDSGDGAWPSVPTLARLTGKGDRAVQDSLRRLVDKGELEVVAHGAPLPKTPRQYRPNAYCITLGGAADNTTDLPTGGAVDFTSSGAADDTTLVQFGAGGGAVDFPGVVQPTAPNPSIEPSIGTPHTPHVVGGQPAASRVDGTNPRALGSNPRARAELEADARRLIGDGYQTEPAIRERFDGIGSVPPEYVDALVEEVTRLAAAS